jgi:hypothetical protein
MVQNFFLNMDFMGIKRRRILHRFQKYKLTLVTKCENAPEKVIPNIKFPSVHRGPPLYR